MINMMKSADAGQFHDVASVGRFNSPRCWRIFFQRQVCPELMMRENKTEEFAGDVFR